MSLLTWAFDHLVRRHGRRVDVRLRVHRAYLRTDPPREAWFMNVWNRSPERAATITHVWVDGVEGHVPVLTRPLPVTIPAGQQWETWIDIGAVAGDVTERARAKVSETGETVASTARDPADLPPAGFVPGRDP